MSAESLTPGTREKPATLEVSLLCPSTGLEADFRAIETGGATHIDLPARLNQRKVTIRLEPVRETIRKDKLRDPVYHVGDTQWWVIDSDGKPQGAPRRGNFFLNLEVTAFDAPAGVLRTKP